MAGHSKEGLATRVWRRMTNKLTYGGDIDVDDKGVSAPSSMMSSVQSHMSHRMMRRRATRTRSTSGKFSMDSFRMTQVFSLRDFGSVASTKVDVSSYTSGVSSLNIDTVSEFEHLIGHESALLVFVFTKKHSDACKRMWPMFWEVIYDYTDFIEVRDMDVARFRDLAEKYSIKAVPYFLVFKKSKIMATVEGFDEPQLREVFDLEEEGLTTEVQKFRSLQHFLDFVETTRGLIVVYCMASWVQRNELEGEIITNASQFPTVKICRVDVTSRHGQLIAEKLGVDLIPSIHFFRDGLLQEVLVQRRVKYTRKTILNLKSVKYQRNLMRVVRKAGDLFDIIVSTNKVLVVYFFLRYSSSSKTLEKHLDTFAANLPNSVLIFKFDLENERHLIDELGIVRMPTLFVFNRGEKVDEIYPSIAASAAKISTVLKYAHSNLEESGSGSSDRRKPVDLLSM